jgi:hypothetical protein
VQAEAELVVGGQAGSSSGERVEAHGEGDEPKNKLSFFPSPSLLPLRAFTLPTDLCMAINLTQNSNSKYP